MAQKKLTHAELADAQAHGDWPLLWQHAMPLVKLVIGRMRKDGAAQSDSADDDGELLQQGMLIAGEAMRAWRPVECAFSTHITTRVRGGILNHAAEQANAGVGSREQKPVVLSLGDERPDSSTSADDEDADDDGTFDAALTYAGVVMPGGQFDGDGTAPGGYADPAEEADRLATVEQVRAVVAAVEDADVRDATTALLNGEHIDVYAARRGVTPRTVRNWLDEAKAAISTKLSNLGNS